MSKRIVFEDGSALKIIAEILAPGEMATNANRSLMEFIETELIEEDVVAHEDVVGLDDLDTEDLEDLDETDLSDFDEEDFEDLDDVDELDDLDDEDFDDEDEAWDDEDEFDDRWQ